MKREKDGTTKRYAEKLSEMTNIDAVSFEDIKDLSEYDFVIHFGALYAGDVKGLKKTVNSMKEGAMIDTFGTKVDFVDFIDLNPIVETIHKIQFG